GIIPIKSVKMATYMNERIPGVDIPDALIQKIADAGDDKNQIARVSVEIAAKTIQELRSVSPGVHLMAIGWENYIPQILTLSQP
ncbi:MAG: methylenetetrahydrofolate reductase, partial [Pseudomonadota bacterium]